MSTHNNNYEPTSRVNYEHTTPNPYLHDTYLPPPPPEYYMHQRTGKAWKVLVPAVLLLFGVVVGVLAYPTVNSMINPTVDTSKPTPYVPFSLAAVTAEPTAYHYDAKSIIQDFQAHGLPLDQLQYGMTINQFVGNDYVTVITLNSSAEFIYPSFCNGPCDVGSVWLGVYNSPIDARSEYKNLNTYTANLAQQPGPGLGALGSIIQTGRCVLIGEPATSEYAGIIRSDCT